MAQNIPMEQINMMSFKNALLEGVVRMELVVSIMSKMQENYNYTICLSLIQQSSGKYLINFPMNHALIFDRLSKLKLFYKFWGVPIRVNSLILHWPSSDGNSIAVYYWSQDPYNWCLLFLDPIQKFCLKIVKTVCF